MERLTVKALFALTFLSLALNIIALTGRRAAADPPPTDPAPVGSYHMACTQMTCHSIDTRTGVVKKAY